MAAAPERAIYWVDRAVDVRIDDGVVVAHIYSGRETIEFRAPISVLLLSMGNMAKCYAQSLARSAKILPFERR